MARVKTKTRGKSVINLALAGGILVLFCFIGSLTFKRFDLTEDKRHSLTPATVQLLDTLSDIVNIKVYLKGELEYHYQKLGKAVKEKLDEFKAHAGSNIKYEFIDPYELFPEEKEREEYFTELAQKGLKYNRLVYKKGGASLEKVIFPGATLYYQGKESSFNLTDFQIFDEMDLAAADDQISQSINNLEYNFARTIRKLFIDEKPSIGFIDGHGELPVYNVYDISESLREFYKVERYTLNQKANQIKEIQKFDAIVIARPDTAIPERDKFIIDQYIMNGGKAIWLVDQLEVNNDSLMRNGISWGLSKNLGLDDMFFKYGVRFEKNLALDKRCQDIMLIDGYEGGRPRFKKFPWLFNPTATGAEVKKNLITSNINPVLFAYTGTISLVGNDSLKKEILLTTSDQTMVRQAPVRVSTQVVGITGNFTPDNNKGPQPLAVMVEGKFNSNYKGRIPQAINQLPGFKFKDKSKETKQLFISDGNVIENSFNPTNQQYYELGFDRSEKRKLYGNKEFFLNAVDYMLKENGLISLRSRTVTNRKLNIEKAKSEKSFWQFLNVVLPILIIVVFAVIRHLLRIRKYAK